MMKDFGRVAVGIREVETLGVGRDGFLGSG